MSVRRRWCVRRLRRDDEIIIVQCSVAHGIIGDRWDLVANLESKGRHWWPIPVYVLAKQRTALSIQAEALSRIELFAHHTMLWQPLPAM